MAKGTDTSSTRTPTRRRVALAAGVGTLGAAVALGTVGIAGAASPGAPGTKGPGLHGLLGDLGGRPVAIGKVATVGSGTFTVTTLAHATDTVDVTSSTSYWEPETTSVGFADLKAGQYVAVVGTAAGTTVQATRVDIVTAKAVKHFLHRHLAVIGTVASVGDHTFSVTPLAGGAAVTVDVTSSTHYREPGTSGASFASVTTGEKVAVLGQHATGTVTAKTVVIAPPAGTLGHGSLGARLGHLGTFGTVASVGSNTFSVTPLTGGNAVNVDVTGSTHYREPGTANASISDVTAGAHVVVFGPTSAGGVQATAVLVLPAGFGHAGGAGASA